MVQTERPAAGIASPGSPPADPAGGQTEASVGAYLSRCGPGDPVAIHERDGPRLTLRLATVSGTRRGRVYTAERGVPGRAWHMRTGRSCWHPKGGSRLVEPTPAVRSYAEAHPRGAEPAGGPADLYGTDAPVTG